ncbi:hypothetical protein [Weissella cibaria]|uniref:hypothetical protein n=1 Tax=Weissella cibaria TaxID=137591 RepID=UPI001C1F933E|nr:hypothetical protein [Weissella cibaria]MBU7544746.1 hypothetical protein [Weissella cibaria]MCV3317723.1 hypothetical protein [Weissella cibaria]
MIKLRVDIAWAEQLHFNYLLEVLLLVAKDDDEQGETRPVSSATLGRFIAADE